MPSALPANKMDAIAPLLGSLARRVTASNAQISTSELEILLHGVGQDPEAPIMKELALWSQLLTNFQQQPSKEHRQVTAEALKLRGLSEAAVYLALSAVDPRTTSTSLRVSPPDLDFGTLQSGETGSLTLKIEGDTGTIAVDFEDGSTAG